MFNHILAIDIAHRFTDKVDEFILLMRPYAHKVSILSQAQETHSLEAQNIDAIMVSIYQEINRNILQYLHNIRHIFILGTSTQKIDSDYCQKNNITIHTITEYCDHETAEWVLMTMLHHYRYKNLSLYEKKLGVIGVGAVGNIVLTLGHALGMKLAYNSTKPHHHLNNIAIFKDKKSIFHDCDIISIHTPSHSKWFSKDLLHDAKKDLLIINTSMGAIDHNQDLQEALTLRPDINIIMDSIAQQSYAYMKDRAIFTNDAAFLTKDVKKRLITKFINNIKGVVKS